MSAPTTVQWLRTAVGRVGVGSARVATHLSTRAIARAQAVYARVSAWLGRSSGLKWCVKAAVLIIVWLIARKAGAAIVTAVYVRIESGAWAWLLWAGALAWVVAAYRAGHSDWNPKPRPEPRPEPNHADDEPAEGQQQDGPVPAAEQMPDPSLHVSVSELVAAVDAIGTPHAQLVPLAKHLGTTTEHVRAAAARAGWEVKDVRMRGRSSALGLSADRLAPLSSPAPSRGVVGAGQPADDDNDDAEVPEPEKGFRVERIGLSGAVVHDPADVVRHHSVRHQ